MLAILLVFMMVFTLIPGTALAGGGSAAGSSVVQWQGFGHFDSNNSVKTLENKTPITANNAQ